MDYVQATYTDCFDRGFPGQIFNPASTDGNSAFHYPTSTVVFIGRAVKGVALTDENNIASGIALADVDGITEATEIVGIVISDKQASVDDDGNAYLPANTMATVMRFDESGLIYSRVAVAVAAGDSVFVATAAVNDANIAVGEFTNAAGTGLLDTTLKFYKGADAGKASVISMKAIVPVAP